MIKILSLTLLMIPCFVKLSITSFREQLEYPGILTGTTYINYTIEIDNPKEDEILVEGIWVKGRWINFNKKSYAHNPIVLRASVKYINIDTLSNKAPSPTKNKSDLVAVKYRLKGKSKLKYLGIGNLIKESPIARP